MMTHVHRLWRGEFPLAEWLLSPLTWVYAAASAAHRAAYLSGCLTRERVPCPVVCIGNLVSGGAGKTPVTLLVSRRLLARGRRVGVISRGYGRRSSGCVVVSRGSGPILDPSAGGDEAVMLAHQEPRLRIVVAERRSEAATKCLELGCDVLVMDDGYSHHALQRDLDILLVDAAIGFGNGRLLPTGPLREPIREAGRAGLVWLSKAGPDDLPPALLTKKPFVRSAYSPLALVDGALQPRQPVASLAGAKVAAWAAIARPESFRRTLEQLGARVVTFTAFGDHRTPTPEQFALWRRAAADAGADLLLTTEKDIVKLSPEDSSGLFALAMRAEVFGSDAALEAALDALLERRTG